MTETTIDLLRHGELEGGIRYRGCTEAALTPAGRAAMDAVWCRLRGEVDAVVTSPLSRCREPAEAWAAGAGIPCMVMPDLREMEYGAWEGLAPVEIEARFPGWLARWRSDPESVEIPDAERIGEFAARVVAAWEKVLADFAGRHVLVVAHSGTLRVIVAHVLGAPLAATRRLETPYATWARVVHDARGARLAMWCGILSQNQGTL